MSSPDTIEVPVWVKKGGMLVRRDALDWDDPDHTWNYLEAQGLKPAEYGFEHPLEAEFKHMTRSDLIAELVNLRQRITVFLRMGFE
jgi:hypothetical protein